MFVLQVHQAYQRQGVFFNYLISCHDLWEQADVLVAKGNHTGKYWDFVVKCYNVINGFLFVIVDFFIDLDHANGPITLHSTLHSVVKYVQDGIQKLRRNANMWDNSDGFHLSWRSFVDEILDEFRRIFN